MINNQGLLISVKGYEYFLTFDRVPWMRYAAINEVLNVRMCGRNAIEWPELDIDLEIESLQHPEKYPLIMRRNEFDSIVVARNQR